MASITRRDNGKFLVRWREGGRGSRQLSRQFGTEAEAREFAQQLERPRAWERVHEENRQAFERGELTTSDAVFLGFASEGTALDEEWSLEGYMRRMIDADRELRPTTRALYLRNLRVHIAGSELGRADVRAITPEMLTQWWVSLKAGVGARRNVHQLVSKAFNRALLVGDVEVNPLKRAPEVKRPGKGRQEEVIPLTVSQLEALAEAAREQRRGQVGTAAEMARERDRLEILVMSFGGLRAGEVGGLSRRDVVRVGEHCQLRLRQQVTRVTGQGASLSPLKTRTARRTVSIPCSLADELDTFIGKFTPAADGRVFRGPNGEMRAHNDINHSVASAGRRIGLDVNAHMLRHTAVSLLIDAGANAKAIQAHIGHAAIRETMDTYGHLFDQGGAALADIMEGLREQHRNGS